VFTVASADALACELDEQQYEHETGPCLQSLYSGEVVEAADLAVEDRWEAYPSIAMTYGILAVLSTPLMVEGKPVGVLNLYAGVPQAFSEVDRQLAMLLAGQAAIAITAALRRGHAVGSSAHRVVLPFGHRPGDRDRDGPTAVQSREGLRDPADGLAAAQYQTSHRRR
jgi:GAF domain-containing protein